MSRAYLKFLSNQYLTVFQKFVVGRAAKLFRRLKKVVFHQYFETHSSVALAQRV